MGGCPTISLSLMEWFTVDYVILCGSAWWLWRSDRQNFVFLTKIVLLHGQKTVKDIKVV